MKTEYLDVVDEENNPTGTKELRSIVHSTGLRHRTVHVYFFRKKRNDIEFLVHQRPETKDLHPNKWAAIFGGHVKSGATVEETVLSEIKEETGSSIKFECLIQGPWLKAEDAPNNREFNGVFYLEYCGRIKDLRLQKEEIQAIKWMPASEIEHSMIQNPSIWMRDVKEFRAVLQNLKEKITCHPELFKD